MPKYRKTHGKPTVEHFWFQAWNLARTGGEQMLHIFSNPASHVSIKNLLQTLSGASKCCIFTAIPPAGCGSRTFCRPTLGRANAAYLQDSRQPAVDQQPSTDPLWDEQMQYIYGIPASRLWVDNLLQTHSGASKCCIFTVFCVAGNRSKHFYRPPLGRANAVYLQCSA